MDGGWAREGRGANVEGSEGGEGMGDIVERVSWLRGVILMRDLSRHTECRFVARRRDRHSYRIHSVLHTRDLTQFVAAEFVLPPPS